MKSSLSNFSLVVLWVSCLRNCYLIQGMKIYTIFFFLPRVLTLTFRCPPIFISFLYMVSGKSPTAFCCMWNIQLTSTGSCSIVHNLFIDYSYLIKVLKIN